MRPIHKIIISSQTNKRYLIKEGDSDIATSEGVITKDQWGSKKVVETSKGVICSVLDPQSIDLFTQFSRGPQIMIPKDVGYILSRTGIGKDSVVAEAGTGSAAMGLTLARICKQVYSYEVNPLHLKISRQNKQLCGAENLEINEGDIATTLDHTGLDLINLDLPEPWKVIPTAQRSLKQGGFLVAYLPHISQVQQFVLACQDSAFSVLEVTELMQRYWKVTKTLLRPDSQMLGHTAFLVICRKLGGKIDGTQNSKA